VLSKIIFILNFSENNSVWNNITTWGMKPHSDNIYPGINFRIGLTDEKLSLAPAFMPG